MKVFLLGGRRNSACWFALYYIEHGTTGPNRAGACFLDLGTSPIMASGFLPTVFADIILIVFHNVNFHSLHPCTKTLIPVS